MPVANTLAIQGDQLTNLALDNQQIPDEGSKAVRVLLDFSLANQYTLDLTNVMQRGFLSMIQTMFVDMSTTDVNMDVAFNGSLQTVRTKGRTQGYYPVMSPSPCKVTFTCPGGPGVDPTTGRFGITVYFFNIPIPGVVWATV